MSHRKKSGGNLYPDYRRRVIVLDPREYDTLNVILLAEDHDAKTRDPATGKTLYRVAFPEDQNAVVEISARDLKAILEARWRKQFPTEEVRSIIPEA